MPSGGDQRDGPDDPGPDDPGPDDPGPAGTGWRGWWRRLSTTAKAATAAVVGAGAVASALTAIGAVLPDDPPPAKVTFQRPVHLNPFPVPMTGFTPREADVEPAAATTRRDDTAVGVARVSDAQRFGVVDAAVVPAGSQSLGATPVPAQGAALTPTPIPIPTPTPTETDAPPSPDTVSPSPSDTEGSESTDPADLRSLPPGYAESVASDVAAAGWELPAGDREVPGEPPESLPTDPVLAFVYVHSTDPEGNAVSPEDAAEAIVQKLEVTRSTTTASGRQVPVGVVVRAAIRIQNAVGEPVRIDWALENADSTAERLSQEWLAGTPAVELRAETRDDRGVFDLWVPLPEEAGTYVISVTASRSRASDSLPDDFITTRPFS